LAAAAAGQQPHHGGGVGFVRDRHRVNVALTRAKSAVIVVGDAAHLAAHDATWRRLVAAARAAGQLQPAEGYTLFE
jgi:superfamily I DNA and/or RNA helicase